MNYISQSPKHDSSLFATFQLIRKEEEETQWGVIWICVCITRLYHGIIKVPNAVLHLLSSWAFVFYLPIVPIFVVFNSQSVQFLCKYE